MPTPRELCLSTFRYNPESGLFEALHNPDLIYVDGRSGKISVDYFGKKQAVTNVIWYIMTGKFPERGMVIDHIDRDPSDNRWRMLRKVTPGENSLNRRKGYYRNMFLANVNVGTESFFLGWYKTKEERDKAVALAYKKAEQGEFSTSAMLEKLLCHKIP